MDKKSVKIAIEGMSCMACVGRVEKALKNATGALSVHVDLARKQAQVEFDPARTSLDRLCEVISEQGYKASGA